MRSLFFFFFLVDFWCVHVCLCVFVSLCACRSTSPLRIVINSTIAQETLWLFVFLRFLFSLWRSRFFAPPEVSGDFIDIDHHPPGELGPG